MARSRGITNGNVVVPIHTNPRLNVTQSRKVASAIDHYHTRRIVWTKREFAVPILHLVAKVELRVLPVSSGRVSNRAGHVGLFWFSYVCGDNPFASKKSWQSVSRSKLKITMNHSQTFPFPAIEPGTPTHQRPTSKFELITDAPSII